MRNIADIIADDKNGKKLSQTERQIAVAYIQGKYDAVLELKIGNNSNTNEVLDKIRAEIKNDWQLKKFPCSPFSCGLRQAIVIIDKYREEVHHKESEVEK